MHPQATHSPPKACGLAVASLVCGCLGCLLGFLTGIPAIITGHLAQAKIKRGGGSIGGSGVATTGLVLGYVTTLIPSFILILAAMVTPAIFKALERANMAANVSTVRQLQVACMSYAMDHDGQFPPDLQTLETSGEILDLGPLRYKEAKTKLRHDWLYFAGYKDRDAYDTILIAAPMTTKGGKGRVVAYLDGSVRPVRETEYLRQVLAQQAAESSSGP